MAVEDEVRTEGSSSSSPIRDSHESDEKRDVLSPEDIAWVDSCLIKESEISDGDWDSMKDALLEVMSSQPGLNSSASVSNGRPADNDIEMLTFTESAEADRSHGIEEETEESTRTRNPFLPSYVDGLKETQTTEPGTDLSSSVDDIEPSTNDIFRVWDLNIPAEENELDKQLNKIIEESDRQSEPAVIDDSSAEQDLKEESLDDVIAALSEITLN